MLDVDGHDGRSGGHPHDSSNTGSRLAADEHGGAKQGEDVIGDEDEDVHRHAHVRDPSPAEHCCRARPTRLSIFGTTG